MLRVSDRFWKRTGSRQAQSLARNVTSAARCAGRCGLAPLPAAPQTLALYLKALETQRSRSPAGLAAGTVGLSLPTLRRRLAAIASRHATLGLETPTEHSLVRRLLRRYSRARGTVVRKNEPLLIEQLPAILMAMPEHESRRTIGRCCRSGMLGVSAERVLVALDVGQLRYSRAGCFGNVREGAPRLTHYIICHPRLAHINDAERTRTNRCKVGMKWTLSVPWKLGQRRIAATNNIGHDNVLG